MGEIIKVEITVDKKTVEDFLFSSKTILNEQQKNMFIQLAIRNQLDPFKREIYAVPYGQDFNILTGYEVYLKRAEASGQLDGWKVWTEGTIKEGNLKACIEIKRKDWSQPLDHEVLFTEYDLKKALWLSKPVTMIKKVAIAQGFRLAFPVELGGMPYTTDEIPHATDEEIIEGRVIARTRDVEEKEEPESEKKIYSWRSFYGVIKKVLNMTEEEAHQLLGLPSFLVAVNSGEWTQESILKELKHRKTELDKQKEAEELLLNEKHQVAMLSDDEEEEKPDLW